MQFLIILLVALLASTTSVLAEVVTYNCKFDKRADLHGLASEELNLIFKIDSLTGKAIMQGNVGLVDVEAFVGNNALSIFEKSDEGFAQTTTISRDGDAVHSRHSILLGETIFAQHYGSCVPE